jgi:hypothetical protein
LLNDTFVYRRFALAARSARDYKYGNQIIVGLTIQRAAPAVTRRKEYDQTSFGRILSYGMIGAYVLFRLFFNINSNL